MHIVTNKEYVVVSRWEEEIIHLGMKRHERYRVITDFKGPITGQVFSRDGTWIYGPLREEDRAIIPKAAFRRHAAIAKAGYRVAQVVIGHEIKILPDEPHVAAPKRKSETDWGNVAEVAGRGLMVGIMGIVMVPLYALSGLVMLIDPSYCIVLDNDEGSVIELMRWSVEV